MSEGFPHLLKAMLLQELYNNSQPQGWGWVHYQPEDMTLERALAITQVQGSFDYVLGRVIKVNFDGCATPSHVRGSLYDRDLGPGAFARCLATAQQRFDAEKGAEKARD